MDTLSPTFFQRQFFARVDSAASAPAATLPDVPPPLTRRFFCERIAEEPKDGEVVERLVIATTADADRYDDIVDQESINVVNWVRCMAPMLYAHESRGVVVGRGKPGTVKIGLVNGKKCLVLEPEWDDHPLNGWGQLVKHQWGTFINSVSIGFRPGKVTARTQLPKEHYAYAEKGWGLFFENCEILEVSVVPVPANPFATDADAKDALPLDEKSADDLIVRTIDRILADPAQIKRLADGVAATARAPRGFFGPR